MVTYHSSWTNSYEKKRSLRGSFVHAKRRGVSAADGTKEENCLAIKADVIEGAIMGAEREG